MPETIKTLPAWNAIAHELAATPGALAAWTAYKPVSPSTVRHYLLGYGTFPGGLWDEENQNWCHHPRLIVPLTHKTIVGFACRAAACTCTKWLAPAGSRRVLFNAQRLRVGLDVVIVCSNPVDALLVGQAWEGVAVATLGMNPNPSGWRDGYTSALRAARPKEVVVWFGNTVPGQATNPHLIASWKRQQRACELDCDESRYLAGIKLANRLRQAGLPATFYRWPNTAREGADLGEVVCEELRQLREAGLGE
jgi:hypothetical protein